MSAAARWLLGAFRWNEVQVDRSLVERSHTQLVSARYVRFAIAARRFTQVTEVQVLDTVQYTPFDLRVARPQ